ALHHGTAVASLAAGTANNGGVVGVDWHARLVPVKVLDSTTHGYVSWFSKGIEWARKERIPIVNMSLGVLQSQTTVDSALILADQCLNSFRTGQLLVAASGNVASNLTDDFIQPSFPAAYHQRVVAVGAM